MKHGSTHSDRDSHAAMQSAYKAQPPMTTPPPTTPPPTTPPITERGWKRILGHEGKNCEKGRGGAERRKERRLSSKSFSDSNINNRPFSAAGKNRVIYLFYMFCCSFQSSIPMIFTCLLNSLTYSCEWIKHAKLTSQCRPFSESWMMEVKSSKKELGFC